MALDQNFWDERWRNFETGWDIGGVSPAIQNYVDDFVPSDSKILIPGCGSAHEAKYLADKGFKDIHLLDISPTACQNLKTKFTEDSVTIHCGDIFEHQGEYDYILEQTLFCAIDPSLRPNYVVKMAEILKPTGTLFGLLFDTEFEKEGPPFGGSRAEYLKLFGAFFKSLSIEPTNYSIEPRAGNEVFLIASL